jgi:hypothetical protein
MLAAVLVAFGFSFRTSGVPGVDFVIHPDAPYLQGTLLAGETLTMSAAEPIVDILRAARTLLPISVPIPENG